MKTKLSVQAQFLHDPSRDLERLRQLNPVWVKYHQADPNRTKELLDMGFKVCLRLHSISEMQRELAANPRALGQQHGEFWIQKLRRNWGFSDSQIERVAVEGINEPSVANEPEANRVNVYGMAFAETAAQQGIRVATPNLSTGWPYNHGPDTPPDYEPFRGLVEVLRRTGSYWASHEYCDKRGPASDDWLWNMGRILQRPVWFKQSGVKILITECAYDQAVNAPPGTGHHSWQGHMGAQHYASNILGVYDYRMHADTDVEALMIFLLDTDNPPAWGTFNVDACWPELVAHARWLEGQPEPADWSIYLPDTPSWPDQPDPPIDPPPPKPDPPPNDLFERSISFVLAEEGGFQADPNDPGNYYNGVLVGTKYGISAASWGGQYDIKNLTIEQAKRIYREHYWIPSGAHKHGWPLCLLVLDTAILHGVGAAQTWVAEVGANPYRFAAKRLRVYTNSDNWRHFGAGWVNRTARLLEAMADRLPEQAPGPARQEPWSASADGLIRISDRPVLG